MMLFRFIYDGPPRFLYMCDLTPSRFTAKERDDESRNDYIGPGTTAARWAASSLRDWNIDPGTVPYA
jgi:hypothetical protein